jgi:hypothetical protein
MRVITAHIMRQGFYPCCETPCLLARSWAAHTKPLENNGLKFFAPRVIFHLPNCSCFVLIFHMSSTLYQDPSLIIPQRPVRVRFQARRAGFDKARSAMRDFTLLLALAWGAAEMALWLSGG